MTSYVAAHSFVVRQEGLKALHDKPLHASFPPFAGGPGARAEATLAIQVQHQLDDMVFARSCAHGVHSSTLSLDAAICIRTTGMSSRLQSREALQEMVLLRSVSLKRLQEV